MGRHKKVEQVELGKDQYITEKSSISKLSGKNIQQFVGDTYNHSIQLAWEWVEMKKENGIAIQLVDYYPQIMGGKSILVSYNVRE